MLRYSLSPIICDYTIKKDIIISFQIDKLFYNLLSSEFSVTVTLIMSSVHTGELSLMSVTVMLNDAVTTCPTLSVTVTVTLLRNLIPAGPSLSTGLATVRSPDDESILK